MLSNRFLQIFSILVKIGNCFGSFSFSFDPKLVKASNYSRSKQKTKVYINLFFCILIFLTSFYLTIEEYIYGIINKLLLKALFSYGLLMMLLMYLVTNYHVDDLVLFTNATFGFLRHIQSKKNILNS